MAKQRKCKVCGPVEPRVIWKLAGDNAYKPWDRCPICAASLGKSTFKGAQPPLPGQKEFSFSDHREEYL